MVAETYQKNKMKFFLALKIPSTAMEDGIK